MNTTEKSDAMFYPGIKIGPQREWKDRLVQSGSRYCEVWFNIGEHLAYVDMFSFLKKNGIHTGLHFWGVLENNIMANLAYPEMHIWKKTRTLMEETIRIAQENRFEYVNIHLGNFALETIDFTRGATAHVENTEVSQTVAERVFEEQVVSLHRYAQEREVRLITETIPPCDPLDQRTKEGRLHQHQTYALTSEYLEYVAKKHQLYANNDISHTACGFGTTKDREKLWGYLLSRTIALLPYTTLVHLNTLTEPFNGTDSHNGILDSDFNNGAFPNKKHVNELLRIFSTQNGVWVINEPSDRHVENYQTLKHVIRQIGG